MSDQTMTPPAMIDLRFIRSASRPMGMPSVQYRIAKERPPSSPICVSVIVEVALDRFDEERDDLPIDE